MNKSPQEIIFSISNQVKGLQEGDEITLRKINEETGHHYNTLKSYIDLIEYIQTIVPPLSMTNDKKGGMVIKINGEPRLPFDEMEQLLLYLIDHNGYREVNAIELPVRYKDVIKSRNEMVAFSGSKAYLTLDGLLSAALIAERREDLIMDPIGKQFSESQMIVGSEATCYSEQDIKMTKQDTQGISNSETPLIFNMNEHRMPAEAA